MLASPNYNGISSSLWWKGFIPSQIYKKWMKKKGSALADERIHSKNCCLSLHLSATLSFSHFWSFLLLLPQTAFNSTHGKVCNSFFFVAVLWSPEKSSTVGVGAVWNATAAHCAIFAELLVKILQCVGLCASEQVCIAAICMRLTACTLLWDVAFPAEMPI